MNKKDEKYEKACYLCEYAEKICSGEYCMCSKKGVVSPDYFCKKFIFDPLKISVSVRKLPDFIPDFKIES